MAIIDNRWDILPYGEDDKLFNGFFSGDAGLLVCLSKKKSDLHIHATSVQQITDLLVCLRKKNLVCIFIQLQCSE